jgi:dipeptidyl aminopeptidase/acylaminoacyl peptidase
MFRWCCAVSAAISPDNKILAVAYGEQKDQPAQIVLRDVERGKELRTTHNKERKWFGQALAFSPDGKTLAVCATKLDDSLQFWKLAADKVRGRMRVPVHFNGPLAFAQDDRTRAAEHADGDIRLWSVVTGLAGDADKAHAAVWQLTADPKRSEPFLAERLHAAVTPPPNKVSQWIAELDNDDFATRHRATTELEKCGDTILAPLRAALRGKPSLESRHRLESILETVRAWRPPLSGERLRSARAIEVLEHIGSVEARSVLKELAGGAKQAWLTSAADASLPRLSGQAQPKP